MKRWFGELTNNGARQGVFPGVLDLNNAIQEYLDAWNEDPKPFVWTATVESILEKLSAAQIVIVMRYVSRS